MSKQLNNIELLSKEDGIWFSVKSSSGKHALININILSNKLSPIVGAALLEWANDNIED